MVSNSAPLDRDFSPGPALRHIDWDTFASIARAPYLLFILSGLSGVPLLLSESVRHEMRNVPLVVGGAGATIGFGVVVFLFVEVWPGPTYRRPATFTGLTMVIAGIATTLALVGFGPRFGIVALTYPEPMIYAFALFTVRWAVGFVVLIAVEAGAVFALQDGWYGSFGQWTFVLLVTLAVSVLAGQLAARMIAAAAAEHAARDELAELNETLQQRVAEQVGELERTGQLRRFLAPQVADAVVSGDADHLLDPHRRRIAVFFCDLRGFTSFAAQTEPEDVMEVLGTYYRVVGERLRASDATVGSFAGDGIMAYLNDPVPCDDPAGTAVAMAMAIRADLDREVAGWRRAGYELGYGIGIAVGYATLGVVGFEGRQDYTALGTVVNLAARLCAAARPGQVLIDPRTAGDLDDAVDLQAVTGLALKGFPAELEAFAVRPS